MGDPGGEHGKLTHVQLGIGIIDIGAHLGLVTVPATSLQNAFVISVRSALVIEGSLVRPAGSDVPSIS